jgi:hypothetical protein
VKHKSMLQGQQNTAMPHAAAITRHYRQGASAPAVQYPEQFPGNSSFLLAWLLPGLAQMFRMALLNHPVFRLHTCYPHSQGKTMLQYACISRYIDFTRSENERDLCGFLLPTTVFLYIPCICLFACVPVDVTTYVVQAYWIAIMQELDDAPHLNKSSVYCSCHLLHESVAV